MCIICLSLIISKTVLICVMWDPVALSTQCLFNHSVLELSTRVTELSALVKYCLFCIHHVLMWHE